MKCANTYLSCQYWYKFFGDGEGANLGSAKTNFDKKVAKMAKNMQKCTIFANESK